MCLEHLGTMVVGLTLFSILMLVVSYVLPTRIRPKNIKVYRWIFIGILIALIPVWLFIGSVSCTEFIPRS